jgi:predicted flap endonuclease-1-like 5' DNA nuclease
MGLLDTLRSLFGLDSGDDGPRETTVSVEHEPRTGTETAVKGEDVAPDDAATPDAPADESDDSADDSADDDATDDDATHAGTDEPVDVIKGIGPAYADRLSAAGVDTVADLLAADPADLAAETDLSETRIDTWVERAEER